MALSSWQDQVNFASYNPNLAPAKSQLPNADYGRVAALKLVDTVFPTQIQAYVNGDAGQSQSWGNAGRFHYYILGRSNKLARNEFTRAGLNRAPAYDDFEHPILNVQNETEGPLYFRKVLSEVGELSRVYGIPFQTLTSAVLNQIYGVLQAMPPAAPAALTPAQREGWLAARMNFAYLESMWGIRRATIPKTMNMNSGIASRQTYKKSRRRYKRNRRGFKKRRRYY